MEDSRIFLRALLLTANYAFLGVFLALLALGTIFSWLLLWGLSLYALTTAGMIELIVTIIGVPLVGGLWLSQTAKVRSDRASAASLPLFWPAPVILIVWLLQAA